MVGCLQHNVLNGNATLDQAEANLKKRTPTLLFAAILATLVAGVQAQSDTKPKQIRLMPSSSIVLREKPATVQIPVKQGESELAREKPIAVKSISPPAWFEFTNADETLYLGLRRWAAETGHQLVWDAGMDFPVKNTVYATDDVLTAVSFVMADTEGSSYPLHACTYNNKVIRILNVAQSCSSK